MSCTSATFCVAVDKGANFTQFSQLVTSSEQLTWNSIGSLPLLLSDGTNYYVYGPTAEPVEQVNVTASPPSNNPVFLTYTSGNSSWLVANAAGDELSYYRYDAYGSLSSGSSGSPFGYAGQYTDTSSDPTGFDDPREMVSVTDWAVYVWTPPWTRAIRHMNMLEVTRSTDMIQAGAREVLLRRWYLSDILKRKSTGALTLLAVARCLSAYRRL